MVARRFLIGALVVPAYVFATGVFLIFLIALGVILGARVVSVVSDYGHTYSIVSTKRCLVDRGRRVEHHRAVGRLDVTYRHGGVTEWTSLWFARTPEAAKRAEFSDSERRARRGNVLFEGLVAGGAPSDPAIDECLDRSRAD